MRILSPAVGPAGHATRVLLALLAGLLLAVAPGSAARAHAALLSSDPPDGAVLDRAPSRIVLTFTEPVSVVPGATRLFTSHDRQLTLTAVGQDATVTAELPALADNARYVVAWRVISTDGHPVTGTLSFAVGDPPTSMAPVAVDAGESAQLPGVDAAYAVVNALAYVGLLLMAGLVVFDLLVRRDTPAGWRRDRLIRAAAVMGVAGTALLIPLGVLRLMGTAASTSGPAAWWQVLGARPFAVVLLALAGATAVWSRRSLSTPARRAVTVAVVGAALLGPVLIGHTALRHPAWLIVTADGIHLVAAAVWLGGLIGLLGYLRSAESNGTGAQAASRVVARFSILAATVVAALGASGTVMAVMVVKSWSGLVDTTYGRTLLMKIGLVAFILAIAAWNQFRLGPTVAAAPDTDTAWPVLRRTLTREAALLVTVLAVTGTLVNLSPNAGGHTGPNHPAPQDSTVLTGIPVTASTDGLVLTGEVRLAEGGGWQLTMTLLDGTGTPVLPVQPPDITSSLPAQDLGPFSATAAPTETAGEWTALLQVPYPGEWTVSIGVRMSTFQYRSLVLTLPIP